MMDARHKLGSCPHDPLATAFGSGRTACHTRCMYWLTALVRDIYRKQP